jgi:hypothetical protein
MRIRYFQYDTIGYRACVVRKSAKIKFNNFPENQIVTKNINYKKPINQTFNPFPQVWEK